MSAIEKEEPDISFADEEVSSENKVGAGSALDDIPKEQRYLRTQAYDKSIVSVTRGATGGT
jgi:hypothetical protein